MSKRYPGNFITGNPVTLSQTSNNGIWDVKDVSTAVGAGTWQEPDGIHEIGRSLRFRPNCYLQRTPGVSGNQHTWTFSTWAKITPSYSTFFSSSQGINSTGGLTQLYVANSQLIFFSYTGGTTYANVISSAVFRDPAAWYHVVFAYDDTEVVSNERVRLYVNGVRITSLATNTQPSQNFNGFLNQAGYIQMLGEYVSTPNGGYGLNGYQTEVNFVDGKALDPSYFGYTDSITGIWQPKRYTGGYGTNGFYLPLNDNSSLAALCTDKSSVLPSSTYTYNDTFDTISSTEWNQVSGTYGSYSVSGGNLYPNYGSNNGTWHGPTLNKSFTNPLGDFDITFQGVYCGNASTDLHQITLDIGNGSSSLFYWSMSDPWADGAYESSVSYSFISSGTAVYTSYQNTYSGDVRLVRTGNTLYCYTDGVLRSTTTCTTESVSNIRITAQQYTTYNVPTIYFGGVSISGTPTKSWGTTNISLTPGVTYDSMVDSPTNIFTSATDVGGVVTGNYATWNSLLGPHGATPNVNAILSNGNLTATDAASATMNSGTSATIGVSSGKWYWENILGTSAPTYNGIGITFYTSNSAPSDPNQYGIAYDPYASGGAFRSFVNGSATNLQTSLGTPSAGDNISVALDCDAQTIKWFKNNVQIGTTVTYTSYLPSGVTTVYPGWWTANGLGSSVSTNFGQRPFAYTPPSGHKSINTTNLQAMGTSVVGKAAIQPHKWFDAVLWTGNGAPSRRISDLQFKPDLFWSKERGIAQQYVIVDSARSIGAVQDTSSANADYTGTTYGNMQAFNDDGFTATKGSDATYSFFNKPNGSYVAWNWKQSPTSGLNIITYTGTGVSRNITHNLGVAPKFIVVKQTSTGSNSWFVYHASSGAGKWQALNLTNTATSDTTVWNNTAPTSSQFSVGTNTACNGNGATYVAYLWAEVPGFSDFGSYICNASTDGPFVNLGFKPRWVMIKYITAGATDWMIFDSERDDWNASSNYLRSNSSAAEGSKSWVDFLSNGFKVRNTDTTTASINFTGAGGTFIYAAFAESPFALNNRAR